MNAEGSRAFFEVYGELGYGFPESVYRSAMTIALRDAGLVVEPEVELHARLRGRSIGAFRADLMIEGTVLILNFGPTAQVRRLVFANQRQQSSSIRTK
jgi:GxxExxY protein